MTVLTNTIDMAYMAREQAIATNTKVGVCIYAWNDALGHGYFQGANLENSFKKTYHAEEVALIQGLMAGYRGEDFSYMIQIAFAEDEIYPCCLSCLSWLYEYTHPDFIIYTIYNHDIIDQRTLKEMTIGFKGVDIYPKPSRRQTYL